MRGGPGHSGRGVYMAPASKAQQKAVAKYMKENYDRFNLVLPKGRKAELQEHAQARGESLNGLINRAIDHEVGAGSSRAGKRRVGHPGAN